MKKKSLFGVLFAFFAVCLSGCEKVYDLGGTYRITWNNDNGESIAISHDVDPGSKPVFPMEEGPVSALHSDANFLGWSPKIKTVHEDATYTAVYAYGGRVPTYSIIYDLDGGDNNDLNPYTYEFGSSVTLYRPTKLGCEFLGWFNQNGEQINYVESYTTGNVYLTAKWSEFHPSSINISIYDEHNQRYNDYVVGYGQYFEYTAPEYDGYEFDGFIVNGSYYDGLKFSEYIYEDTQITITYKSSAEDYYYWFNDSTNSYSITGYHGTNSNLSIPSSIDGYPVTEIEDNAFYNNYTITSVTIPFSVVSIGDCAFQYCSNITSVTINGDIEYLGNHAFENCLYLNTVSFNGNCTFSSINDYTFHNCWALQYFTIPDCVTSIGSYAFDNIRTSIVFIIPANVVYVGANAFDESPNITIYYYSTYVSNWHPMWNNGVTNYYLLQ